MSVIVLISVDLCGLRNFFPPHSLCPRYLSHEVDPKGGISRLAKMRKPQCTGVHEDFRSKRNAEITLLSRPPVDLSVSNIRSFGIIV